VEERAAEETPQPASQPEEQTPEPTLVRHVNREGGYSFRYPDSWTLDETGEVTTVSSTDGRYVVSFALGPEGTLGETYESFVGLLERSYREVAVTRRDNVSLSGGSGLLVGGQAVNSSGTHVAFRAVLLPTAPQSVVRSGGARPESPTIGAIAATDSAASFDQRLTDVLTSVEAR
jgi:hypothetical protein